MVIMFNLVGECCICDAPLFTCIQHSKIFESLGVMATVDKYKSESNLNIFRNRVNYCRLGGKKCKVCGTCLRNIKQTSKNPRLMIARELGKLVKPKFEKSLTMPELVQFAKDITSDNRKVIIVTANGSYKLYLSEHSDYSFPIVF